MINYLEPNFSDLPGRRPIPRNYKRGTEAVAHIDVSIITPYYNTEEFFVETFISVNAQSLQNWEWVIVDDGSTDQESVNRLADIVADDERIKIIRQDNAGPGAARNTAYRNATGRYVCLLDSDDMVEPTYLEKCVWFLDSNPEFAFCNSYSIVFGEETYLFTSGFERGKSLHLIANIGPPISVIRYEAFSDCGGFEESIRFGHEDWDFWLAMAKAGHWGYTIPEFLQWYRKRSGGRFEQIMRSGNINDEFKKMIHLKYAGLGKHFPKPSRRYQQPYETIETNSLLTNPLAGNPLGCRIMFIVPWMVMGGADRVNLDLIEGLTSRGHDITVCATLQTDHQWEHEFTRFTPDVFVLPNILRASDFPRFLAYLIQSRQIDTVIVTASIIGYQFLPYLRSVSPGVAFVDMCHVEDPNWLNGGFPRFGVGYQDLLDLNIVTTGYLAEWMRDWGADSSRIRLMYTGVRVQSKLAVEVRGRVRTELNISADMPVIVFAGRLCEQKRPDMLVEILRVARDSGLKFQALVIGEGELGAKLKSLLKRYRLSSSVSMLGSVPHQRWLDILAASDILLMPSQFEGISIALLEAMAAGVIPVVANVGGQVEIVSQDAGILIPHGDNEIEQYLEALTSLINEPARLHSMSANCKALVASKFSWDQMIDNFQGILDEAHQLRVSKPRLAISPGLGKELASLSLEYKRFGELASWPLLPTASQAMANISMTIGKFVILLNQTRLGRAITSSPAVRRAGRQVLNRLKKSGAKK